MPIYDYKCAECSHEFKKNLRMDDRKIPESEPCPSCEAVGKITQQLGYAGIVDPIRLGRKKPDSGFNQVLKNIQKGNPGSTINIRD